MPKVGDIVIWEGTTDLNEVEKYAGKVTAETWDHDQTPDEVPRLVEVEPFDEDLGAYPSAPITLESSEVTVATLKDRTELAAKKAMKAFWNVVATQFPGLNSALALLSSDMSFDDPHEQQLLWEVERWVLNNVSPIELVEDFVPRGPRQSDPEAMADWVERNLPALNEGLAPPGLTPPTAKESPTSQEHPDEDWPRLNRERGLLIDKQIAGELREMEALRLQYLTGYADAHIAEFRAAQHLKHDVDSDPNRREDLLTLLKVLVEQIDGDINRAKVLLAKAEGRS